MKDHSNHHVIAPDESSPKEYAKLALVLISITLISLALHKSQGMSGFSDYLRWFMGVFFIVFSSFKFVGYKMFVMMFAGYDVVAKRFKPYAYAYPFIELGLGLLYLTNSLPNARDFIALLVMGVGTIGVLQEIKKRSGIHCACLGNIIKLPLSTVSLIEDLGMAVMALAMLILF
jgi:hypothetical protein